MIRNLRVAIRMLRKHPGFAAITVVPLALGIGATAAVFSLIRGVLLTPPPFRQPDRLVLVPVKPSEQQGSGHTAWTAAHWLDWQEHAASFDGVAAYSWSFNFLVRDEGSQSIEGMYVTPQYFRVTGLQPMLVVFGEGFRLVAWGLAAGIAVALALARVWRVFLFGVQPTDPVTIAAASLLFVAVSLLACWVPTVRATGVDPIEALRAD